MKRFGIFLLFASALGPVHGAVLSNIIVDQFGYKPADPKIVIFAQPNTGVGSPSSFNLGAGATFNVINVSNGATVFTGSAVTWGAGATDSTFSGDKVWQGTFTTLSAPGTYYVQVPGGSNPGGQSYNFQVLDSVYNGVVTASQRMFFYQRCGMNISSANGGANWNHTACHEGANQDLVAHLWNANADQGAGTARDVHGGWHDAGDYGKYVTFAHATLWYLMHSAEWYPNGYGDNTNIPESGNGVPDMLDEVKYELDWMLRMQRSSDGALYSMVGYSNASTSNNPGNPANDTAKRYYLNVSTTATATGAMAFALGARLFQAYPLYSSYAVTLQNAAVSAWGYLSANPSPVTFDSTGVSSANANQSSAWDAQARVAAAAELFALTGSATYQTYFDANYNSSAVIESSFRPVSNPPNAGADHFDASLCEPLELGMVSYCLAPGATAAVVTAIKNSLKNECQNYIMNQQVNDPYLGYMYPGHYTWGSNQLKASWGNQLLFAVKTNANPAQNTAYANQAEEYLHYFHGRNPLNWVYLTNMGTQGANLGASKSIMSIYHSWFYQGTTFDGNTGGGAVGPAPGILAGGPNQNFAPDASYSGPTLNPPQGQPPMKSYKDWGNTWPEDSWEVTEPDQGYQGKYQFLLSAFAVNTSPTATPTATPTGTLATATPTPSSTATLTPTATPSPTATVCVVLLNGAETLAENGTWSGTNASRAVTTLNATQGTHSLQVNVTTGASWNDQLFNLTGFTPNDWTSVTQLKLDINVSSSLTAGQGWTQLFLRADSPTTFYQPISGDTPTLVAGQNNDVTFNINWAAGGITQGSSITALEFVYNSGPGTVTGTFYLDNLRLFMGCSTATPTPSNSPTATPTWTPTLSPTNSPTSSPTSSPTASTTPTASFTATPSPSPTNSPTITPTPLGAWNSVFLQPSGPNWVAQSVTLGGRPFKLDDYSYSGYKLSQVGLGDAIPCNNVTVSSSGDITTAVRTGLSTLVGMGGGTLWLPSGSVTLSGTVTITGGNIRILGAGSGATTVVIASSYNPGDKLTEAPFTFMGGGGISYSQWAEPGKAPVTTSCADVNRGDLSVTVGSAASFAVGNWVVVQQYFWPNFSTINSAGNWTTDPPGTGTDGAFSNTLCYPRKITAIAGNVITLDAPIPFSLHNSDATVWFYKPNGGQYIENDGIEGMTIQVLANSNDSGRPAGTALAFKGVFNGWARDVKVLNVAKNGIKPAWSTRITVLDCSITGAQDYGGGGWGYGFYTYASSAVLFKRCTATNLRHNFTTEYAMTNMVVYTRCNSIKTMGNSASVTMECDDTHFAYSQRLLWDMMTQTNNGLLAENRETQSNNAYETFAGGVVWNYSGTSANPYGNWQAGSVQCSPATYTSDSDALIIGPTGGATIYDNSQDLTATYVYGTVMSGNAPQVGPRGNVAYEGIDRANLDPPSLFDAQLQSRLGSLPPDVAPVTCASSPTPTPTPSATSSPTRTPTSTPTFSPTATPSATPSASPTASLTSTATFSATLTPTASPTGTPTDSPTGTLTPPAPTATPTHSPTATRTLTPTLTATATNSPSPTSSPTKTQTPTNTPTTGPVLQVSAGPAAPPDSNQAPGAPQVPVMQVQLQNLTGGPTTVGQISLTASGTGNDQTGITSVKVYLDSNGNGIVDGGDSLLASGTYPANDGTLTVGLSDVLPGSATQDLLIVLDISSSAPSGTYQTSLTGVVVTTGSGSGTATGIPYDGAEVTVGGIPTATPTWSKPVVYPNPSDGTQPIQVAVPLNAPTDVQVRVFTTAFRLVAEKNIHNMTPGSLVKLDPMDQWGSPLASGLYYVVVKTPTGKTVGKILILR
ncbi:MAG TPA: glycoside hydrolase family 9 protein [bacterium]|nr:glycoside hydrolase family 9 protein [bacterium]